MSFLGVAEELVTVRTRWARADVLSRRGPDVLLAVAMLALAATFLTFLPGSFSVDSWLALVGGREVWTGGIPHVETLTALSHGASWIDQQWLSELASYALYRVSGFALLGAANVALLMAGVAGALAAARALGARPRAVLVALPLCMWLAIPSREIRTQEFAIPLFVAITYLLASDSRAPSRRVYWCLPLLAVWGNLHGTVTLGVGLVCLRGITLGWERRALLRASASAWRAPLALVVGAPLCLLITPYGLGALSYYDTMFLHGAVRHAVSEWQPITSSGAIAIPFFVVAAFAIWSFGRHQDRTTVWERLALLALAAGSILVIRNVLFFALCALVVVPLSISGSAREIVATARGSIRARINGALLAAGLVAVTIAVAGTFARPSSVFELSYQRAPLLTAVERAMRADPSLKVLADVRFADWLLWRDPAVAGRIANDARFELLSATEMKRLQAVFGALGPDWKAGARGFRLLVLDRRYDPSTPAFIHEPGARMLYDDGDRVVILRAGRQAA